MRIFKGILFISFILNATIILSQTTNIPLSDYNYFAVDTTQFQSKGSLHSLAKPFSYKYYAKACKNDTLFRKNKTKDEVKIEPVLNALYGSYMNINYGAAANATFKNKAALNLTYIRGVAYFPDYVDSVIQKMKVIPGLGYAYYGPGKSYVYNNFSGYVNYSPNKFFDLEFGQGKHFWGDGYRTFFLSDNAYNYPYLKITAKVWKFNYTNLFTNYKYINPVSNHYDINAINKYATYHLLSYNVNKRWNIALFESIIFQNRNPNKKNFGYDVNYLNPVIFFRPVEYSLGSGDNAIVGLSMKIMPVKNLQLYGQIVLDEFYLSQLKARTGWWANKYALQAGLKAFNLFTLKGLHFQGEANYARPYIYSHGSPAISYTHFGQALAHPIGANFIEAVAIIKYSYKGFYVNAKANAIIYGADNYIQKRGKNVYQNNGQNIFLSYNTHPHEFGNKTLQGTKTAVAIGEIKAGYKLFKKMNFRIEGGIGKRIQYANKNTWTTPYYFIGFTSSLYNQYLDF